MAERTLQMIFDDSSRVGSKVTVSVPKADDTIAASEIKAAMVTLYDNREVFTMDIGAIYGARFVTPTKYDEVALPA